MSSTFEPLEPRLQLAADLSVTNIAAPASGTAGDTFAATATVANVGNLSVLNATQTAFFLSTDSQLSDDDVQLAVVDTPPLAAGASVSVPSGRVTIPTGLGGVNFILVVADFTQVADEATRDNNVLSTAFQVNGGASLTPRLVSTTVHPNSWDIVVRYTSAQPITAAALAQNTLSAQGAANTIFATVQRAAIDANKLGATVVYRVAAPDGGWSSSDTGTWTINEFFDGVPSLLGSFFLWFPQDAAAPGARVLATTVTKSDWLIPVQYSDNVAVDASSVNSADIAVRGPNGFDEIPLLVSKTLDVNGMVTAVYDVRSPSNTWAGTDTGKYSVFLQEGEVRDSSGNAAPARELASYFLFFKTDTRAPVARIVGTTVTQSDWLIAARFTDDTGIDPATIRPGALSITGPNDFFGAGELLAVSPAGADGSVTAIFRVRAPGTSWQVGDSGRFTVSIGPGEFQDAAGNGNVAQAFSYFLFFDPAKLPSDKGAPVAVFTKAGLVSPNTSTSTWDLTVHYADDLALDFGTLGTGDVRLTGSNGYSQLGTLEAWTATSPSAGTATYRFTSPGASWAARDNGTYTLAVRPNEVQDLAGNGVPAKAVAQFFLWFG